MEDKEAAENVLERLALMAGLLLLLSFFCSPSFLQDPKRLTMPADVTNVQIDQEEQRVVLETTGSIGKIAQELESSTGLSVRVRGLSGADAQEGQQESAVCIFQGLPPHERVKGVMRVVSLAPRRTVFEASLSGLPSEGLFGVNVRTFGDISGGGQTTGPVLNKATASGDRFFGFLGLMRRQEKSLAGSATLRLESEYLQVHEMIGRSMVLERLSDESSGRLQTPMIVSAGSETPGEMNAIPAGDDRAIAVGIIARSAGVFANTKRVCACSGKTLWEEETIDVFDFLQRRD
jgi:copper chaperone for superoxide dismutase